MTGCYSQQAKDDYENSNCAWDSFNDGKRTWIEASVHGVLILCQFREMRTANVEVLPKVDDT